jgi:succinate dehydrogenase/fumarate reductase flavoprotein subunit
MKRPAQLERRGFLKNTAVATATLATAGVLGVAPASAADAFPQWDKQADVVIIGSGIAGMCASIEAADAGARVILLEKDSQPGGCAKFSGGHMTVAGTDVEARANVEDKPEWLYQDMMEDSEMVAVPELIRKYVEGGREHIRWLEGLGIKFEDYFQYTSNADRIRKGVGRGHVIARSPDYPGGPHQGGLGVMVMLMRAAQKRGVSPLLEHKMTRLIRADQVGPVVGVEVESAGKRIHIKANCSIVLAAGGWSGNLRMGLAEDPRMTPDIYPDCWPYHLCLGEGHVAAVDIGAELSNMAFGGYLVPRWGTKVYQIWEPPTFTTVPSIHTGVPIEDFKRLILVKGDGKRYINELVGDPEDKPSPVNAKFSVSRDGFPDHPFIQAYLNLQERPRNVWAVTDDEGAKALGWYPHIDQVRNPNPKSGLALYPEMAAVSDSLPDLAAKMKIDAAGLQETVLRYNRFVDLKRDDDFGKPEPASKIAQPPFYGVKMALIKHTRRNGIRVNTRGQVLDRAGLLETANSDSAKSIDDEKPIPRLYAAGECAHYLGRYHGHGTLGIYSFYGRVAGKSAALEQAMS